MFVKCGDESHEPSSCWRKEEMGCEVQKIDEIGEWFWVAHSNPDTDKKDLCCCDDLNHLYLDMEDLRNAEFVEELKIKLKTKNKRKKHLLQLLSKYKVIGDTTYGIGYKESEELVEEILKVCTQ